MKLIKIKRGCKLQINVLGYLAQNSELGMQSYMILELNQQKTKLKLSSRKPRRANMKIFPSRSPNLLLLKSSRPLKPMFSASTILL